MRSLNTLLKGVCLMCSLFFVSAAFAQPANDNVANAEAITVGSAGAFTPMEGATAEAGEDAIVPVNQPGCAPHGWCDPDGITASVWYTFVAPTSGIVLVDICGSSFDSQLAVYEVGDATDFSTFAELDASDDTPDSGTPGVTCGPPATMDAEEVYGLASTLTLECLTPGVTYYVVVDVWSNDGVGATTVDDFASVVITEVPSQGIVAGITSSVGNAPGCQGGADGSASITFDANYPVNIDWSTGAEDVSSIDGLTAGTYTVTVSDACGTVVTASIDVMDGPAPATIAIDDARSFFTPPSACGGGVGNGTITLGVTSGNYPYDFTWSDGGTGATRDSLAAGVYTVTINDLCGNPPAVRTFALGYTAGDSENGCIPTGGGGFVLGGDAAYTGGDVTRLSYLPEVDSDDATLGGIVRCAFPDGQEGQNGYLRVFDLVNDFGLSGVVNIQALEAVVMQTSFGPDWSGQFPARMSLHTTDNEDLTAATGLPVVTEVEFIVGENVDGDIVPFEPVFLKIPVDVMWDVDAEPLLVMNIFNPGGQQLADELGIAADFLIEFAWGGYDVPDPTAETYLYAGTGCVGAAPGLFVADVGFGDTDIYMSVFIGEDNAPTYSWEATNGGTISATDIANPTALTPGTYSVTVTDPSCGTTFTDQIDLGLCTDGIVEAADASFTIAPNPSSGLFNMQNQGRTREFTMEVFDIQGKLIMDDFVEMSNGQLRVIDLNNQARGMYVLKLTYGDSVEVHRLLVQ